MIILFLLGNPQSIINSMWLNMTMHFGLRGRQEHTQMLWGDVQLNTDESGREYLEFNERMTKTRPGNSKDVRPFQPKMFATGELRLRSQCVRRQDSAHARCHVHEPPYK